MTEYYPDINQKAKDAMVIADNWTQISVDEPICVICGEQILNDVPLRLFNHDITWEIDFHIDCAINGDIKVVT